MRGRPKPLSDYVGASNIFVYGFRRYVVVIFLVISHIAAQYAKLQRFFEVAIGYAVKHNRLPLKSLLFYSGDTMFSEEGVKVGAVDVDFAPDLREGDDALVPVVLPCLWRDSEDFPRVFGFYPFAAGVVGVTAGDQVDDLLQRVMEVAPLFFRYHYHCH